VGFFGNFRKTARSKQSPIGGNLPNLVTLSVGNKTTGYAQIDHSGEKKSQFSGFESSI
jgi:hypothetical protein